MSRDLPASTPIAAPTVSPKMAADERVTQVQADYQQRLTALEQQTAMRAEAIKSTKVVRGVGASPSDVAEDEFFLGLNRSERVDSSVSGHPQPRGRRAGDIVRGRVAPVPRRRAPAVKRPFRW